MTNDNDILTSSRVLKIMFPLKGERSTVYLSAKNMSHSDSTSSAPPLVPFGTAAAAAGGLIAGGPALLGR